MIRPGTSRLARRRRPAHSPVSHERWLVSYADFITLLFAFFTTMYAISTVDSLKLGALVDSMQAAFANGEVPSPARRGGGPGGGGPQLTPGPEPMPPRLEHSARLPSVSLVDLQSRLSGGLARQIRDGVVELRSDPRGLIVSLREAGAFPTGSAELSLTARAVLALVGRVLAEVGNGVRVEGHTDNVPISTARYRSNWELSTARATNVVAFLLEQGLEPHRLAAAGYGEFHPRTSNETEAGRAMNRRVDIVILNAATASREEPQAGVPSP